MKKLFIDTETTGLNFETDQITELAYIYEVDGKIKKKAHYKSNIYNSFLRDLDEIISKFDKNDKAYFIAYNADFDTRFIRQLFLNNKNDFYGSYFYNPSICLMQYAAHKFMRKNKRPENFKLGTLLKHFKIPFRESSLHDALYDAEKTRELYKKLLKF